MADTDALLTAIAERRYGVVTTELAVAAGVSPQTLARQVRRRRAKRLYRGVYLVGVGPFSEHTRWRAALDAAGHRAALSGWAATRVWRLSDVPAPKIDVVSPTARRSRGELRVHVTNVPEHDVTEVDGLRVLRVERLLVELAEVATVGRLCRLIDIALFRQVLDLDRLREVAKEHLARPGSARLRLAIDVHVDGGTGNRSRFEESTIDRIVSVPGVPRLVCNRVEIAGLSVEPDVRFPTLSLMVEVDDPTHDQPLKRRSDERNDRTLKAHGIDVLRIHWSDVDGGVARVNRAIVERCRILGIDVPARLTK